MQIDENTFTEYRPTIKEMRSQLAFSRVIATIGLAFFFFFCGSGFTALLLARNLMDIAAKQVVQQEFQHQ